MKSTNILLKKYSNLEFEAEFINIKEDLMGFADIQGRQNGLNGIPGTVLELRPYCLDKVETVVQGGIDYNQQLHLPVSGMVVAQRIQTEAKEKVAAVRDALHNEEHTLQALKSEEKRLAPDLRKRKLRRLVYVGVGILAIAEGFFVFEAFRASSFSTIAALLSAVGIAVVVGFGSHFLSGYVQRAKSTLQRRIRLAVVLVPALLAFYAIGCIRAASYNTVVNVAVPSAQTVVIPVAGTVSPWTIAIISFIFFGIALYVSMKVWRSEEEVQRDEAYNRVEDEKNALVSEMDAKRNEIATIEREAGEAAAEALAKYEYALAAEQRLVTLAKEAFNVYRETNLRFRPAKDCPHFFGTPPPFQFKFFFDNVKREAA